MNNNNRRKKSGNTRKNNNNNKGKNQNYGVERSLRPQDIMPPFKDVVINYVDPEGLKQAAGIAFKVWSLRINGLYDVDPLLLSTGVAGFNQLMKFYEFYRVNRVTVNWNVANRDANQSFVGFCFSQTDLSGVITTRLQAADALENGLGTKAHVLQQVSGGPSAITLQHTISLKNLLGDPSLYNGDSNYIGTASSNPSDLLWVNFIVYTMDPGLYLANGVGQVSNIRFGTRMFGRTYLNDASSFLGARDELSIEKEKKLAKIKNQLSKSQSKV